MYIDHTRHCTCTYTMMYKGQTQLSCNLFCNYFVSLSPQCHLTLILATGTVLSSLLVENHPRQQLCTAQCASIMYRLHRRESAWSSQPSNVVSPPVFLRSGNNLTHERLSWARLNLKSPFVIIHAADLRLRGRHHRSVFGFQLPVTGFFFFFFFFLIGPLV